MTGQLVISHVDIPPSCHVAGLDIFHFDYFLERLLAFDAGVKVQNAMSEFQLLGRQLR